jgi:RcsF protein
MAFRNVLITTSFLLAISGCAGNYTVKTNLDKENFQRYYGPTEVTIYDDESSFTGRYQFVGLVEGQDCQEKPHLAAPDEIIARTEARRQAFEQKANGIIFTGCAMIESKQCTS